MIRDGSKVEFSQPNNEVQEARKAIDRGVAACLKRVGISNTRYVFATVTLTYSTISIKSIPQRLQDFISVQYPSRGVTAKRIEANRNHINIDVWPTDDQHPYGPRSGYIVVPSREIALGDKLHLSLLTSTEGEFPGKMTFGLQEHSLVDAMNNRLKDEKFKKLELDPTIVKVIAGMLPPEYPPVMGRFSIGRLLRRGVSPLEYANRAFYFPHREVSTPV